MVSRTDLTNLCGYFDALFQCHNQNSQVQNEKAKTENVPYDSNFVEYGEMSAFYASKGKVYTHSQS